MAINLSKNSNVSDYQKLVELNKASRRARRHRKFMLFMTIFMFVAGMAIIFLGFALLAPTKTNFALITLLQFMAFGSAFCYYECYLLETKPY